MAIPLEDTVTFETNYVDSGYCLSCDYQIWGDEEYCSNCGEET